MTEEQQPISGKGSLAILIVAAVMIVPSCIIWGFVVHITWSWLAPVIWWKTPMITWVQGAALRMLLLAIIPMHLPPVPLTGSALHQCVDLVVKVMMQPLVILAMAWVVAMVVR